MNRPREERDKAGEATGEISDNIRLHLVANDGLDAEDLESVVEELLTKPQILPHFPTSPRSTSAAALDADFALQILLQTSQTL